MKYWLTTIVFTVLFVFSSLISYAQSNTPIPKEESISVQEDPKNELGLINAVKNIEKTSELIKNNNYSDAEKILVEVKEWLTDVTDFHFNLYKVFEKNPKMQSRAKIEKAHALDFGRVRDQSYYLLAKVYIAQNKLKEAVKLLVEIVKSQPDSELGQEAYKTLVDIKFSDKTR